MAACLGSGTGRRGREMENTRNEHGGGASKLRLCLYLAGVPLVGCLRRSSIAALYGYREKVWICQFGTGALCVSHGYERAATLLDKCAVAFRLVWDSVEEGASDPFLEAA